MAAIKRHSRTLAQSTAFSPVAVFSVGAGEKGFPRPPLGSQASP
jgi:hypothetical protein